MKEGIVFHLGRPRLDGCKGGRPLQTRPLWPVTHLLGAAEGLAGRGGGGGGSLDISPLALENSAEGVARVK